MPIDIEDLDDLPSAEAEEIENEIVDPKHTGPDSSMLLMVGEVGLWMVPLFRS